MANTGYGQERYGRSLYGALTYHEVEAVVQATASTSTVPNINIGITNTPINAVGSIQPTANSQFSGFGVTIGATATNSVAVKD